MSVRKLAGMLFLVNGLQFLMGVGILLGLQADILEFSEMLVELSISLVLLSSVFSIAGLFSMLRYQNKSYRESMGNLESLNTKLREQRHDYLNQIQIVNGLLELGEFEEARDYLKPVFKDIMKVNRALRTAQPAVNALLRAKMETAEQKQVDFYLEVGTQLKELPIEPWEFCKLLGNLIDNAVTAASQTDGERWIRLQMQESLKEYRISVQNNGPEIPHAQRKQIFSQGFTTRKGEGHGMGLAIVSSILKEAGGRITVESGPEGTEFAAVLPKKTVKTARTAKSARHC